MCFINCENFYSSASGVPHSALFNLNSCYLTVEENCIYINSYRNKLEYYGFLYFYSHKDAEKVYNDFISWAKNTYGSSAGIYSMEGEMFD